jgi:hypothetical protein
LAPIQGIYQGPHQSKVSPNFTPFFSSSIGGVHKVEGQVEMLYPLADIIIHNEDSIKNMEAEIKTRVLNTRKTKKRYS